MFQKFLNQYNGQMKVGTNAVNTGECVGLVMKWFQYLGLPLFYGNAKDLLTTAPKTSYDIILNTPTGVPKQGDAVVWDKRFNNTYGHTAIATGSGDTNTFEVFEQNNPVGHGCRLRRYNYNFVLGWIRPKPKDDSVDNYYKGYDLTNKESMKVAVDVLVRVQQGELIDKSLLQVALDKIKELEARPLTISRRAELELILATAEKALR